VEDVRILPQTGIKTKREKQEINRRDALAISGKYDPLVPIQLSAYPFSTSAIISHTALFIESVAL
jgi:hypothetical protein